MQVRQTSSFLLERVRDVAAGKIRPAAMQRPYVWRKSDVEALCDSILSGFPIGSFLLWAPRSNANFAECALERLGPVSSAETNQPEYLLLDGQNRLSTLAWMMVREPVKSLKDASKAEKDTWLGGERLVLDHASRSIKFVPAEESDRGLRLPAWTVLSNADRLAQSVNKEISLESSMQFVYSRWNGEWTKRFKSSDVDDFIKLWEHSCNRFRGARTTETIIDNATVSEARHAFLRICRVGVPISQEDFDRAISWIINV